MRVLNAGVETLISCAAVNAEGTFKRMRSAATGKGDVWRTVKMVIIASPRSTRGLTPRISMRTLYKSHNTEKREISVSKSSV